MSYRRATTTYLGLNIPLEAATNAADVAQFKERQVSIFKCTGCVFRPLLNTQTHLWIKSNQAKCQKLKESSASAYIATPEHTHNRTHTHTNTQ